MNNFSRLFRNGWRRFGITPLVLAAVAIGGIPGARAEANLVSQAWHARPGDDPKWVSPAYPVSGWRDYNLGISSEHQCLDWNPFCVRQTFRIPAAWSGEPLRCELRIQAHEAELYLNGTRVPFTADAERRASFLVPPELLRPAEGEQHLALRIRGHDSTGGIGTDYLRIRPERKAVPSVALKLGFASADHVFNRHTGIRFAVMGTADGAESVTGTLCVRVENEFHEIVQVQQRPATIARESAVDHDMPELPAGFYQVIASFSSPGIETQDIQWFAVAPTELACSPNPPPDLAEFWKRAKAELAAVKPEYAVELDQTRSTARHRVYTVSMKSVGGVTLRAWYVVPVKPGKQPAVLEVPGYGGSFKPEWFLEDDTLIHLALDIRGHGRSAAEVNPGFGTPGYVGYKILEPQHYIYRDAYLDTQRALDFLGSRPEVDAARIAVRGASQGGGLAIATAALSDGRVACCATGVPFLGDFGHHQQIRTVYIPEFEEALKAEGRGTFGDVVRTMSYIDTINLAPWVRCPVLMGLGLFDDDCPPHINFAVYHHLGCSKDYRVYPNRGHWIEPDWNPDATRWLRRQLAAE